MLHHLFKLQEMSELTPAHQLLTHLVSLNRGAEAVGRGAEGVNGSHSVTLAPRQEAEDFSGGGRKRKQSAEGESQVLNAILQS